jgi:hypothetical protein
LILELGVQQIMITALSTCFLLVLLVYAVVSPSTTGNDKDVRKTPPKKRRAF